MITSLRKLRYLLFLWNKIVTCYTLPFLVENGKYDQSKTVQPLCSLLFPLYACDAG